MAGAQARRAKTERVDPASSVAESSHSSSQSRSAANSGAQSRGNNSPPVGTRFDGNRDPTPPPPSSGYVPQYDEHGVMVLSKAFKNVDMGAAAFDMVRGVSKTSLTRI